jgi:type VI secretion system protein ImpL
MNGHCSRVDKLLAAASQRVSQLTGIQEMKSLPVVFLLGKYGPEGSASLRHGGFTAELVAGERGAGIWYGRQTLFVELSVAEGAQSARLLAAEQETNSALPLGGELDTAAVLRDSSRGLAADEEERRKLFRQLLPVEQLNEVLVSKNPPTRSAVVEVDCDLFLGASQAEESAGTAGEYRQILEELAEELEFRLPVYVLFSRADRIAYFGDFAGRLNEEESAEVLGVSLALSAAAGEGVTQAFESITYSLADKRPAPMAREHEPAGLAKVYEFPREFAKLRPLVVQFLADLSGPVDEDVHPFLRGFYFAGARQEGDNGPWVFLDKLFPEVLLADRVVAAAAQGYVRANWMQRFVLAASTVFCLLLAGWWTVGYQANSQLVEQAAAEIRASAGGDSLEQLSQLRAMLVNLADYEANGEPLRYGVLLYRGEEVRAVVQRRYFAMFGSILLAPAMESMLATFRRASEDHAPIGRGGRRAGVYDPGYEEVYDSLKAYLLITRHRDQGATAFLTAQLMRHWLEDKHLDAWHRRLARQNFQFYASRYAGSETADMQAVEMARGYLRRFPTRPRAEAWVMVGENGGSR